MLKEEKCLNENDEEFLKYIKEKFIRFVSIVFRPSSSQYLPVQPSAHMHFKLKSPTVTHSPPFLHGLGVQETALKRKFFLVQAVNSFF